MIKGEMFGGRNGRGVALYVIGPSAGDLFPRFRRAVSLSDLVTISWVFWGEAKAVCAKCWKQGCSSYADSLCKQLVVFGKRKGKV